MINCDKNTGQTIVINLKNAYGFEEAWVEVPPRVGFPDSGKIIPLSEGKNEFYLFYNQKFIIQTKMNSGFKPFMLINGERDERTRNFQASKRYQEYDLDNEPFVKVEESIEPVINIGHVGRAATIIHYDGSEEPVIIRWEDTSTGLPG